MPAIRSDSLSRSSPAPRIQVVPSACWPRRQRTGISSIAAATSAGPRSIARSSEERTTQVGDRLADAVVGGVRGRRSAARRSTRPSPQQVDDRPPGRVDARRRGASARRPGGWRPRRARRRPRTRRPGPARRPLAPFATPSTLQATARAAVARPPPVARPARLARAASARCGRASPTASRTVVRPSARRAASRIADFTWALGTGVVQLDRAERRAADHRQRWQRIAVAGVELGAHRAQWLDDTGHRTASQRRVAVQDGGHRAAPASSRRGVAGSSRSCRNRAAPPAGRRPSRPVPDDPVVDGPAVLARSARRRRRVAADGGRGADVRPVAGAADPASPSARAASIRARWLIDLSPGRRRSPRSRRALSIDRGVGRLGPAVTSRCPRVPPPRSARSRPAAPAARSAGSPWSARTPRVDRDDGHHQLRELVEGQLLLGVGERLVRARVDLDHDPVGPDRDAAERQRRDEPALARRVATDRR